jgi:hypothetical protein
MATHKIIGYENEIKQEAVGGVPVTITRVEGLWRIDGNIKLPKKNKFKHLREARAYLRLLKNKEA